MERKNVVAEIFNAGSENSFESNNDDNMCRKRTELTSVLNGSGKPMGTIFNVEKNTHVVMFGQSVKL